MAVAVSCSVFALFGICIVGFVRYLHCSVFALFGLKIWKFKKMAVSADVTHDFHSLLSSPDRDFLIRNNGDQVKIHSLKGKKLGFYFAESDCGKTGPRFTPTLVEVYNEVSQIGDFEVIFVTADKVDKTFKSTFSEMPWLAIPFSDSDTCSRLIELFHVNVGRIPHLALLDEAGKVVTEDGVKVIREYGVELYPFTSARIQELKDQEEEAKRNQSLRTLLVSRTHDVVLSCDFKKIPVSELEGKTVGLYFCAVSYGPCCDFTPQLMEVYRKLKAKGENFEVVLIPLDSSYFSRFFQWIPFVVYDEKSSKKETKESVPWLSLPVKHKTCVKLIRYFELSAVPTLVIIGPDGKTLHPNVAEAIEDHGIDAYPFTPEKFAELEEITKAKEAAQTIESILVSGDQDFVIGKDGVKIPVSELKGKNVLLYFSASWRPPCLAFLPKLIDAYHEIKAKDNAFEVVFISIDWDQTFLDDLRNRDQLSFDVSFAGMPWLALPFRDSRKALLCRKFKASDSSVPKLVAIGSSGRTVTREARDLVALYGADAYPFTEKRIRVLKAQKDGKKKGTEKMTKKKRHRRDDFA